MEQNFERSGNVFKTIVAMVITVCIMLAVKKVGDQNVTEKNEITTEAGIRDIAGNR